MAQVGLEDFREWELSEETATGVISDLEEMASLFQRVGTK